MHRSLLIGCISTTDVTIRERFEVRKKYCKKNRSRKTLTRKIVDSIGKREVHGISRTKQKGEAEFGSYLSHLEFNAIRWKRKKKVGEQERGGKRKTVIRGSDGSEARGKRMGFNIAGSTEPDGDSYNDGARGLAKPYRLWVRDSTE